MLLAFGKFISRWFMALVISSVSIVFLSMYSYLSDGKLVLLFLLSMFIVVKVVKKIQYRQKQSNYMSEELYRRQQIQQARKKSSMISKSIFKVRSFSMMDKLNSLNKIVNEIIREVELHPEKLPKAQSFFITDLDSATVIIEKYVHLKKQRIRSIEMDEAIHNAEKTIIEFIDSAKLVLHDLMSNEVFDLNIEMKLLEKQISEREIARGEVK